MSRYEIMQNSKDTDILVTYGYDRPLQEYFMEILSPCSDAEALDWGVTAGDFTVRENATTRSQIFALLEKYQITLPPPHLEALTLDLPF